jgi:DHA2 family multidrug resistance protein
VFFINIPVGIVAFYGIWKYIHAVPGARRMSFDMFGFGSLSLAVGALQMFLDRGEQNDWFASTETWVEIVVLVIAFTYFVAHTALTAADKSFFDYRLLKNRNYVTGVSFIFIVGLVIFATRVLLPGMLEVLLDYPVATTGLVTAPSGLGTMLAMLIAGRLIGKVDLRLMLFVGFGISAFASWQMSQYSLDLSASDIVWPNVIQGIGMGLLFVPLSTATFTSLVPAMRAQGTAIFSLMRNIGSSIGISLVQMLLVRNTQIAHASLAERITYANPAWSNPAVASIYDLSSPRGAAALDGAVTQQAAMIAYVNDFWLMCLVTVAVMPLILLIKPTRAASVEERVIIE